MQLYGLIGKTLGHSLSPRIHRRILEALAQHDAEAADLEMRQHMRISKNDTREAARNAGMDAQF